MRFDGKLDKWNDDRGFGFIVPSRGGDPVFVHISAFPRDGRRPKIGEELSFEVEPAGDGKRRAANVQRPGSARRATRSRPEPGANRSGGPGWLWRLLPVVIVAGAVAAYTLMSGRSRSPAALHESQPSSAAASAPAPNASTFRCDGRTHCSQMTSCEEARFFLRNCPGTQMDGNHDGIPCERQWCTGPFAR